MKVKWANEQHGITLVQVPCWWDSHPYRLFSLAAAVSFCRPDLEMPIKRNEETFPISLNPPPRFFEGQEYRVDDVGHVMLASFVDSSSAFANSLSSSNSWWIGEKYDGIRCLWNQRLRVPLSFSKALMQHLLPLSLYLDSEVWNGRGMYNETQKVLDPLYATSPFLRMLVFDSPKPGNPKAEFEFRYTSILETFRSKCGSKGMLQHWIGNVIDDGGEGVILRKPKSIYEHGRSLSLIKLKSSRSDCEALVLDHSKDVLALQLPNGETFQISCTEVNSLYLEKLTKGTIVTLQYDNVSRREIPMNPRIVRIRSDTSWEQIVSDYLLDSPQQTKLNYNSRGALGFKTKPINHWTQQNALNKRHALESLAKKMGLNPLLPDTWYHFPKHTLSKSTLSIFSPYGYVQTLKMVFNDIKFQESQFQLKPKGFWSDLKNRKAYFDKYAERHGFDPLVPENWYSISSLNIFKEKQGASFLHTYNGNVRKALSHAYPDIGLDSLKYNVLPDGYWDSKENRREFFVLFARDTKFDPLVASNWYSITCKMLLKRKGQSSVLNRYNGSISSALLDLFPEIGLQKSLFHFNTRGYWEDVNNRKAFFDEFAQEHNFDPLNYKNWHNTFKIIKHKKYFGAVQHYYKGYKDALAQIYSYK